MAEIIRPAYTGRMSKQQLEYRYRTEPEAGFAFDYEHGKPIFKHPAAKMNYEWCQQHPEDVECLGVTTQKWSYEVPALARCECGEETTLEDRYYGCSQCPHCGRWHAMGGYEVNPPEEWTEDLESD